MPVHASCVRRAGWRDATVESPGRRHPASNLDEHAIPIPTPSRRRIAAFRALDPLRVANGARWSPSSTRRSRGGARGHALARDAGARDHRRAVAGHRAWWSGAPRSGPPASSNAMGEQLPRICRDRHPAPSTTQPVGALTAWVRTQGVGSQVNDVGRWPAAPRTSWSGSGRRPPAVLRRPPPHPRPSSNEADHAARDRGALRTLASGTAPPRSCRGS